MIGSARTTRKIWESEDDPLHLGIRLIDGKGGGQKKIPTDDRGAADIWIEITKGEKGRDAWKNWRIQLTGNRGWELAPGPMGEDTMKGDTMREAPADGYVGKVGYRVGECPQGFYLRHKEQKRYGKLWSLRFEDRTNQIRVRRYLWVKFAVQAEASPTRSLNPE
jgi:hypothetical protein